MNSLWKLLIRIALLMPRLTGGGAIGPSADLAAALVAGVCRTLAAAFDALPGAAGGEADMVASFHTSSLKGLLGAAKDSDTRRYNTPKTMEPAVIFVAPEGAPERARSE